MRLRGRVAIVTGAGRGLGRAIAIAMSREGAYVTIMSRTGEELEETGRRIVERGGNCFVVSGDVSRADEVADMVDKTVSRFGKIDILVNNAAVVGPARFVEETDHAVWVNTIAINLHGAFYCTRAAVPIMMGHGGGKIISITSGLGKMPYPRFCAYAVSKAGIIQLTRSLSDELRELNIQVNAIDPGVMDTAMQKEIREMGPRRLGQPVFWRFVEAKEQGLLKDPAVIAELAVFLAAGESDHLTGNYGTLDEYRKLGWKE